MENCVAAGLQLAHEIDRLLQVANIVVANFEEHVILLEPCFLGRAVLDAPVLDPEACRAARIFLAQLIDGGVERRIALASVDRSDVVDHELDPLRGTGFSEREAAADHDGAR